MHLANSLEPGGTDGMHALHRNALAILLTSLAVALAIVALATSALAQTDPPASGDWTVADTTLVKDRAVDLTGRLTVTSTGDLTLENVTLRISLSSNGQRGIEIASGGSLVLRDSDGSRATTADNCLVVSQPTTYSFYFIARSGSSLSITNTRIEHCGYTTGPSNHQGLFVETTGVVLSGLDVRDSTFGLIVDTGGVNAVDCSFTNCTYQGVIATASSVSLTGCTLADNGYDGVRAQGGTTVLEACVVHHCRWGVMARTSATLYVGNSSLHSNLEGIGVEQTFTARVFNCTVRGNTYYGIHAEYNGQVEVERSSVGQCERAALYAFSSVVVRSSETTYDHCPFGLRANMGSRLYCTADTIRSNTNAGVQLEQASSATLVGSTLVYNGIGVNAEAGTSVTSWATTVRDGSFEAYKLTGASLALHDGTIANLTGGVGIAPDSASTAAWAVHAGNSTALLGCEATLTADMPVSGSLTLSGARLVFKTSASEHRGMVCDGGVQDWQNSTITGSDPAQGMRLELLSGASGSAWFLTVEGAGWSEAAHSSEGFHVAAAFAFHRCTFKDSLRGLVVTGGPVTIDRCAFNNDGVALRADGGSARLENCTLSGCTEDLRLAGGGTVDMINTSYAPAKVSFADAASELRVYWVVHSKILYASGVAAGGAALVVEDADGTVVQSRTATSDGMVLDMVILQSVVTRDSSDDRNPHAFRASLGGAANSVAADVRGHSTVTVTLTDADKPTVVVTSHADGDYINTPTIVLRGTASDPSSPIYDVAVRISAQQWEVAVGKDSWSWTRELPGDGTYPIFVRARDLALNEAIVQLNITLDRRPPRIYVEYPSPTNGSTVGTSVVTLYGYVDDSTATVSWGLVNATMDGSNYEINVTIVDGENLITLVARDPAGNEGSVLWRLMGDLGAPFLRIDRPINGSTHRTYNVELAGATQPGITVYYTVEGRTTSWMMVVVNPLGAFVETLSELGEGTNVIVVSARNAVGNEVRATITIELDTIDPALQYVSPHSGAYVSTRNLVLSGTATEPLKQLQVSGRGAVVDGANFTITVPLNEGPNTLSLALMDIAGNEAYVNLVVNLDTTPPVVTLADFTKNETTGLYEVKHTNKRPFHLTGQCELGSIIAIGDESADVNTAGGFVVALNLTEGRHDLVLIAVDRAGNTVPVDVSIVVDTEPPMLVVESPEENHRTGADHVIVKGTVTPGDFVSVGDERVYSPTGAFEFRVPIKEPITLLVITAEDLAGNSVTVTRTVFQEVETEGLTGYSFLDENCTALIVVAVVLAAVMAAVLVLTGKDVAKLEEDERKLRAILEEEAVKGDRSVTEPASQMQYGYGAPVMPIKKPPEPVEYDEEFVSMDEFRKKLDGDDRDGDNSS